MLRDPSRSIGNGVVGEVYSSGIYSSVVGEEGHSSTNLLPSDLLELLIYSQDHC